jgi:hypothetical protein
MTDYTQVVNDFRAKYPSFDFVRFPSNVVVEQLCETDLYMGTRWGSYEDCSIRQQGWFALLAHTLLINEKSIATMSGGGSPSSTRGIDSVSIGDESQVNGSQIMLKLRPWDDELASTPYGVKYLRLRHMVGSGPFTV